MSQALPRRHFDRAASLSDPLKKSVLPEAIEQPVDMPVDMPV